MLLRVGADAPVLYNGARRNDRKPLSLSPVTFAQLTLFSPVAGKSSYHQYSRRRKIMTFTLRQKFRWQEHRGAPQHEDAKGGAAAHLHVV